MQSTTRWWETSVGYEVYIRSFADGNGDGVGDFAGLTSRLEHLAWLGVDLVWVTPFYPSPMADFGYDVANYVDIDPLFGDLDQFDTMINRAHELGLRIIIDLVPNHTSDQHAWFQDAVSSVDSERRDWYIWRDPAPDGGPPNNWISHFGGPAWTLDEASGQYYCHLFLPDQPDVNWANPKVAEAWENILRFWLERGVDGFRIDVTQGLGKDQGFRSNPELRPLEAGMGRNEQWDSFEHRYDILQPETLEVFRNWRTICEPYDAFLLGETYVLDAQALRHFLEPNDGIHLGFWFEPMHLLWSPETVKATLRAPIDAVPGGIGWAMSSHDDPRAPGRYGSGELGQLRALGLFAMFCGLPGTPFLYQGDELGLIDSVVPPERFADPVVFRTGVESDSRDGCRTPLPWQPGKGFGFSTSAETWLPFGDRADRDTVATQRQDPSSPLSRTRSLLSVRRELTAAPGFVDSDVVWDAAETSSQDVVSFRRGEITFALHAGVGEAIVQTVGSVVMYRSTQSVDTELPEAPSGDSVTLQPGEAVILGPATYGGIA